MNFTKKDYLVIFLYILLIVVQFYVTGLLRLPENAEQTVRLALILLNAFIVLYAYRNVLSADWKSFRQYKWTKWLIILIAFVLVTGIITFIRGLTGNSGGETAASEVVTQSQSEGTNDIRDLSLFAFILTMIMLFIPILSSVTEEVMFRYVLMFKHSGNRVLQYVLLLLSSVAFGIIHYQARGSVEATVPYMFAGLVFGAVYLWKKNIWYNIFAHMMFNGINVLLAFFGILYQRFLEQ
jgi:membrane protease YdiL (CAAX protease family)